MKTATCIRVSLLKKAVLPGILLLTLGLLVTACRKNASPGSDISELRSRVAAWYTQFAETGSEDNRTAASAVLAKLDYDDGAVIDQSNDRKIYLIRKNMPDRIQYLALQQTQTGMQAIGIYEGKSLQQIQQYLETNKLPAGEKISTYALNDKPIARRETTTDGTPLLAMVQNRKTAEQLIRQNKVRGTNSSKQINSYPPDGNCTDYYWVTYSLVTGDILEIEYAFTSCITNGGSGGGSGSGAQPSGQIACQQQGQAEIDASDVTDQTLSTTESTSGPARTRTYHWKICAGLTWSISSHETGTHQYSNTDNKWHWVSFTHNSVNVSGFWLLGNISCTVNSATSNVYDQYAGMQLFFTVHFNWSCGRFTASKSINKDRSLFIEVNQTT